MRLLIAAKASVARAIVAALPHDYTREEGYYQLNGLDETAIHRITWCGGHLLELAPPEAYDPEYHNWRLEHLPIIPIRSALRGWQSVVRESSRAQLEVIHQLLLQANEIIHAGDPDREGQWMVDEVLQYFDRQAPEKKIFTRDITVKRLLVDDLNPQGIRNALQSLHDNKNFQSISASAKARSRADWLYGMNMTRAYTLLGRHAGYTGTLTVGRVQTPVLGMVVKRDEAIESFKAKTFSEIQVKCVHQEKGFFSHALKAVSFSDLDTAAITEKKVADELVKKLCEQSGVVIQRKDEAIAMPPPLPFDLSILQIESAKQFGYSARDVMDVCQQLYEKYHLITYPRSDSRYLPEKQFERASEVLDTIAKVSSQMHDGLMETIRNSDCWIKQSAWDDKKSLFHHAIIPTERAHEAPELTEMEQNVYDLVARYYIAQFYPDFREIKSTVVFEIEGECFVVQGRRIEQAGWHAVFDEIPDAGGIPVAKLPAWQTGDKVFCADITVKQKKSRPSPRFTDASLMQAMAAIAPYVEDPEIKNNLHENDGLGTESTRALIIDGLFKRGFLMKGNKNIFSTPIGRDLVHALPPHAVSVDTTAFWEKSLSRIADGIDEVEPFMAHLEAQLTTLVKQARQKKVMAVTSADEVLGLEHKEKFHCPQCHSMLVHRHGKHGSFWGCSSYPDCKTTVPDRVDAEGNSEPDFIALAGGAKQQRPQAQTLGKNCPDCGKPLLKRKGKRGVFAGCSGFPECKHTEPLLKDKSNVD